MPATAGQISSPYDLEKTIRARSASFVALNEPAPSPSVPVHALTIIPTATPCEPTRYPPSRSTWRLASPLDSRLQPATLQRQFRRTCGKFDSVCQTESPPPT